MITAKDIREKYNRILELPGPPMTEREKMLLAVLGDVILRMERLEERENARGGPLCKRPISLLDSANVC